MKTFSKFFLPSLIILLGLAVGFTVLAQTGEDEFEVKVTIKVTYPIAELGDCGSKAECKSFCDNPSNIESCVAFARARGLMNQAQVERATKFSQSLKSGNTPGNCSTPESCKASCSDISNIEVCTDWAEKNGIKDEHLNEAKKIRAHLKNGGAMPGSCTSETTCRAYCENFDHADECQAFAEKVGLSIHDGEDGPPSQKVFELMKSGKTPGGCRSKDACEKYCQDQSRFEECVAFAEEAGFMKKEEAELVRKSGGQGPGGCRGRECETYCNDPTHQEECFKFAEEHGLIPKEELKRAKEGFTRMKAGIENAPPEVSECLKSSLGSNIIEDIQAGKLTPGPQIGKRVRECFERFGAKHSPTEIFKNISPEVSSCLTSKGIDIDIDKVKAGQIEFTPEMGDTIRICFQSAQFQEGGLERGPRGSGFSGGSSDIGGFLRSAPPEVATCLQSSLGDQFEKLKSGGFPTDPAVGEKIRSCFNEFQPHDFGPSGDRMGPKGEGGGFGPPVEGRPEGFRDGFGSDSPSGLGGGFPPAVVTCLRSSLSEEQLVPLLRGSSPSGEVETAVKRCFTENSGNTQPQGFPGQPAVEGGFQPPLGGTSGGVPSFNPSHILSNFPGPVAECIKRNLIESDLVDSTKVRSAAEMCFRETGTPPAGGFPTGNQFQPPANSFPPPPQGQPPSGGGFIYRPSLLGVILNPFFSIFFAR